MEVVNENFSLKTNSGIENKSMQKYLLHVDVKIERESENEAASEIDLLYADHLIKEEMVIGPEVLHKPIYSSNCSKDVPPLKKTKLEKHDAMTNQEGPQTEATKEIGGEEDITASVMDALPQKKPRLQKQQETTDWQENSNSDTEEGFTPNVDFEIDPSTDIHTKKKEKIKILTKKSKPNNKGKAHKKTKVDCGEHYKRKRQLMQHIESHEKIKHKIYWKCKECTYQTVTRDALKRHKTVHDKSRRYVCDLCGNRFKSKSILKNHLQCVHSGKKTIKCDICDYRTNNSSHLYRHLQIHSGEKPYSCTVCEYKCVEKGSLTKHIMIHSGEKPFSCIVCTFRSAHKSNLTNHMKIHTGEKRFSCTVCEYRSTYKSQMTTHMKIHTGEKSFSCTMCERRCTRKSHLIMHMKTHTGEKPFSCSVCDYRSVRKSRLTNHLKKKHNK